LAVWFSKGLYDWCTFFSIAFCLHLFTFSSHKYFSLSSSHCHLGLPILINCPNHSNLLLLRLFQDHGIYIIPLVPAWFWFFKSVAQLLIIYFHKIAISRMFNITVLLNQEPYFTSIHHNYFNIGLCPTQIKIFTMFILTY
jgi:hypothetical protein